MENPFKHQGEMLPVASINSVYVDDEKASDLFRPSLILQDIIKHRNDLGLANIPEDASLLSLFNELLHHDLSSVRVAAKNIAVKYGNRLAKVLRTLFKPSDLSRKNRDNWTNEHWAYWRSIRNVYLVGGLTSPLLTKIFYDCIQRTLDQHQIANVQISFIDSSQNMATRGLATLIENGEYLLFDFGQTHIKRAHHIKHHGSIVLDLTLEPLLADYLFYKTSSLEEVKRTARNLDNYIVECIVETAKEVCFEGKTIYIAIANYVSDGRIYMARGGYGKLAHVAVDYQTHIQHRLKQELGRDIDIRLFHDTSAMGLLFNTKKHTAVISLGTAFGVAFPSES